MSDLEKSGSSSPRAAREARAYRLVVASAVLTVGTIVGVLMAIAGVIGFGLPFLMAIGASISAFLFKRTVDK